MPGILPAVELHIQPLGYLFSLGAVHILLDPLGSVLCVYQALACTLTLIKTVIAVYMFYRI